MTVVGLGVMGGSLARVLAGLPDVEVRGWSPVPGERRAAREAEAVVEAPAEIARAVAGAELVVLAVPLSATCDLLPQVARLAPKAVLTDVSSLKAPVQAAARGAGLEERWVGSHPLAGSAESGFGASRPDLYRGARIWLVADPAARRPAERVAALWRAVGAEPAAVDAEDHDRLMTLVSHLPQLAANALGSVMDQEGVEPGELGPGGRDMTRLAASSPTMWRDLLGHAPSRLPEALDGLAQVLNEMAGHLRAGRVEELADVMERTRSWKTHDETRTET